MVNYLVISDAKVLDAQKKQLSGLPAKLVLDRCEIDYIYIPYDYLSGDFFHYRYDKKNQRIIGYLFDCTGHDILAWQQVDTMRVLFNYGITFYENKIYKSLGEVMSSINENLFNMYGKDADLVAGISYEIDLKHKIFKYSSAALPVLLYSNISEEFNLKKDINKLLKFEEKSLSSYALGWENGFKYIENEMSLKTIKKLIITSDGLYDLLKKAKRESTSIMISDKESYIDDISSIIFNFK